MVKIAIVVNAIYLKLERGKVIKTKFYYVLDAPSAAPNSINTTALYKVIMVIM